MCTEQRLEKESRAACAALDCTNEARQGSNFCSQACELKTREEFENAPYGDQYAFPTIPAA